MGFSKARLFAIGAWKTIISFQVLPFSIDKDFKDKVIGRILSEKKFFRYQFGMN
jgi:hypothetical protein